ncbi:hypothetical protein BCR34DRAFT_606436 [Clohesyomyces aquaticus]|uniref:Uncharacterized protein n=1 Tax=Clohesyomyces aquaticus TaxID=1231657 RepID=A0A1Y1YPJ0_9PLEO|nr:hypothetical protein BCR34DRAFT_606436 [Clohesyomyces aquaticus]
MVFVQESGCVLNSCGSPSQVQYSLINSNDRTLAYMMGKDCEDCRLGNASAKYQIGLSSSCRVVTNGTKCTRQFTNSFNIAHLVLQDVSNKTLTPEQSAQAYESFSPLTTTPHEVVLKLAIALGALLVISVFIGFISMGIAFTRTSGFSETMLSPLILNTIILNCGTYTAASNGIMEFIKVGAWLLVAAFISRLLSSPILLVGFVGLILFLAFLPIAIVGAFLAACCCGSSSSSTSSTSYRDTSYRDSNAMVSYEPQRGSQMIAMAGVDETQVEIKANGSIFATVRSAHAVVTHAFS